MLRNTQETYGWLSKVLHWLMACMILGLLAVGIIMSDMPASPQKYELYGLHKAFGIIVLSLVCFRILWRSINRSPTLPATMPAWQRHASHLVHVALYGAMIGMPLSGWLMSSSFGYPTSVFGLVELPHLVDKNPDRGKLLAEIHETGMILLFVLLGAHIGAALKHHFIDKDGIFKRMLPR
jgi:cytochrome b561